MLALASVGGPSSASISGPLFRQRFVILGNPEHHFLGFFIGYYVSDRAPLLASREENEWPREDHTNPFAQPERTGIVRVHQKSQDQPGAKVRRNTASSSFDEGQRPSHGPRCDHQYDRGREHQTQQTE